jgi:uncharacterized protein YdeI (BOF family)
MATDVNLWLENRTNLLREDGTTTVLVEGSAVELESGDDFMLQDASTTIDLER